MKSIDASIAENASGGLGVVACENPRGIKPVPRRGTVAYLLADLNRQHYRKEVAVVVAGTFEQTRVAAMLRKFDYAAEPGRYDLAAAIRAVMPMVGSDSECSQASPELRVGDFDKAFG